jgi:hypothetical protein
MSRILCIYPQDQTTVFFDPVYEELCQQYGATGLKGDPTEDDDYLERLSDLVQEAETIVFLGHGSSSVLYGINFNMLICEENGNIDLLKHKHLILFACHSRDFIKRQRLTRALGFGEIPTSDYDVENGKLHGLPIRDLNDSDVEYIKAAIVKIWKNSLAEVNVTDHQRFHQAFSYYTTRELVRCLINRESHDFRLIADVLYYLKTDMDYVE